MKKRWALIIAAVVVVVALAVVGAVYYVSTNNYVAKVGNEKITKAEYNFFLSLTRYQFEQSFNVTNWKDKVGNQTYEEMAKESALEQAKSFKIELINAKESNIKLDKTDEQNLKAYFEAVVNNAGSKVEAEQKIKEQLGISWEQYKSIYRNIALTEKLREKKIGDIKLTDDEIKKYYNDNIKNFEQVTVRHILISTQDENKKQVPEDKQKEAEKKANEILAKVNAGEDFAALAKQYSEDPGSKDSGGEYTFSRGQMVSEFEEWSFSHKPGDTGVVKTDFGYHVMKLENKKTIAFEEAKDSISATLKEERYNKQLEDMKKDPRYNIQKNQGVYESIKIV